MKTKRTNHDQAFTEALNKFCDKALRDLTRSQERAMFYDGGLMSDEYRCECCKQVWEFVPEDYDRDKQPYPTRCPLCNSSIWTVIKDMWGYKDFDLMFKVLFGRFKELFKR
jgi:hypothetical protein